MSCHTCHIGAKNSHLSNAVGDKRGSLRSLKNLILNLILNQIPIQNLIQKSKFKITSHSEFSLWSSRFQDFDFQVDFRSQLDSRVFSFSYFQDFSVSGQKCAKVECLSDAENPVSHQDLPDHPRPRLRKLHTTYLQMQKDAKKACAYYLVCSTYVIHPKQGRCLASQRPVTLVRGLWF